MALIKCPECGKQISDKANVCIGCGYPIKSNVDASIKTSIEEYKERKKNIEDLKKIVHSCGDINNRNEQFLSHICFPLPFYF